MPRLGYKQTKEHRRKLSEAKKDKAENAYLKKCGYNLLRLSETEINNGDFINKLPN